MEESMHVSWCEKNLNSCYLTAAMVFRLSAFFLKIFFEANFETKKAPPDGGAGWLESECWRGLQVVHDVRRFGDVGLAEVGILLRLLQALVSHKLTNLR